MNSSLRAFIGGTTEKYTFTYNAKGQRTRKKYTYLPGSLQERDYMSSCTSDYEYDLIGRLLSETIEMKYSDGTIINKKLVFLAILPFLILLPYGDAAAEYGECKHNRIHGYESEAKINRNFIKVGSVNEL